MTPRKLMNCCSNTVRLDAPNGRIVIPTYHGIEFQEYPGFATFGRGIRIPITNTVLPIGLPEPEKGVVFVIPYEEFVRTYNRKDITTIVSGPTPSNGSLLRKFPVWKTGGSAIWQP